MMITLNMTKYHVKVVVNKKSSNGIDALETYEETNKSETIST